MNTIFKHILFVLLILSLSGSVGHANSSNFTIKIRNVSHSIVIIPFHNSVLCSDQLFFVDNSHLPTTLQFILPYETIEITLKLSWPSGLKKQYFTKYLKQFSNYSSSHIRDEYHSYSLVYSKSNEKICRCQNMCEYSKSDIFPYLNRPFCKALEIQPCDCTMVNDWFNLIFIGKMLEINQPHVFTFRLDLRKIFDNCFSEIYYSLERCKPNENYIYLKHFTAKNISDMIILR